MFYDVPLILRRNIVTHHAEDGSGVGSAIIAGESVIAVHLTLLPKFLPIAMTKLRKDAGLFSHV